MLPLYFEGDNSVMNFDMIEIYQRHLGNMGDFTSLIELKRVMIKHYIQQKTPDHKLRRSYVEILCCQIILGDIYKLQETVDRFSFDCGGNPYAFDEYDIAVKVKEAVENNDPDSLLDLSKKPLFGFLDSNVVKRIKRWALDQPRQDAQPASSATGGFDLT